MIRADSSKLSFNNECIKHYNSDEFELKTNLNKKTGQIREAEVWNLANILGLKYVSIGESETEIEISAKILGKNYLEGINKNTIEQLVEQINKSGLIELDMNGFLDSAVVYRMDITDNIRPTDINKSLLDLKIFSANKNYDFKPHHTGLVITSKHKRDRERLVLYDKFSEVSLPLKANKELAKVFNINDAKGIFRVENNNKSFRRLRRNLALQKNETYFKRETTKKTSYQKVFRDAVPYLKDALQSKAKPNYNIFSKMFHIENTSKNQTYGEIQMLMEYGYKQHQIEKELGMRAIVECCNYNFETIKGLLSATTKGRNARKEQQYKRLLETMMLEKLEFDTSSIEEIEQLLKAQN